MATFGEVLLTADREFAGVIEIARWPQAAALLRDPGARSATARLARVLTRYTDAITKELAAPGTPPAPWHGHARRAGLTLREASRTLSAAPESPAGSALARRLHRTGTALGCGLDLLDTHFTTSPGGERAARSSEAIVIAGPGAALHLLGVVGRYAAGLGDIVPDERPKRLLSRVATTITEVAPGRSAKISATGPYRPPDRVPPRPGESAAESVEAARISALRLSRAAELTPGSAAGWHYTARSAAVGHNLTALTLRRIAVRLAELGAPAAEKLALAGAADRVEEAGQAWRMLAATLEDLATPEDGGRPPLTVDASDLVIRLGRLAHADPAWRPGAAGPPAPAARVVRGRPQAGALAVAALRALDAFANTARIQYWQVMDAARRGAVWTDGPGRGGPRRPIGRAVEQRLEVRHERVRVAGRRAIRDTVRAVWAIKPPQPGLAAEADLILRRHYATADRDATPMIRPAMAPAPPGHLPATPAPAHRPHRSR